MAVCSNDISYILPSDNLCACVHGVVRVLQDVRQATEAMSRLQGFVLLSSDRGGIRIEYARNKMGEVVGGARDALHMRCLTRVTSAGLVPRVDSAYFGVVIIT